VRSDTSDSRRIRVGVPGESSTPVLLTCADRCQTIVRAVAALSGPGGGRCLCSSGSARQVQPAGGEPPGADPGAVAHDGPVVQLSIPRRESVQPDRGRGSRPFRWERFPIWLVETRGIEPRTSALQRRRSTAELCPRLELFHPILTHVHPMRQAWSVGDLNPGPPHCQCGALPTAPTPRVTGQVALPCHLVRSPCDGRCAEDGSGGTDQWLPHLDLNQKPFD
jgi:hypothetical protein